MVDAPRGVKPSLSSMHPPARCTTLPTGRKAVVQKIYRNVSHFQQLCKGVSTLVEWTDAPALNIRTGRRFMFRGPTLCTSHPHSCGRGRRYEACWWNRNPAFGRSEIHAIKLPYAPLDIFGVLV